MDNLNTFLGIIVSILTIIGILYGIIKWIIPHKKINIAISYDRKAPQVFQQSNDDYVDQMINSYFDGPKPKLYHVKILYDILIEADKKLRVKFISATSPGINLQLNGEKTIELDENDKGKFQVIHDCGIANKYPAFTDKHDLTIIVKYTTWGIIPHYVKYTNKIKQSYFMP